MNTDMSRRLWVAGSLIAVFGTIPIASAAGSTLSVRSTALGKVVVDGKGMTAYFYDLDKPNSGVSACSGVCAVNWPAITSSSARSVLIGIKGKVSVLSGTKQLAINGRPIYTFIGDKTRGSTKGQGIGGVWFAISPSGSELKPAATVAPSISPTPSSSPLPSSAPVPASSPSPTDSSSTGTYSYSNY
jgi:predicted lipoprotein with Yx(FWY)xxD motif